MKDLIFERFKYHTLWLTEEQRGRVLLKYILYIEKRWLTLGENALLHERLLLTDKEYLEMKRQLFPNAILDCGVVKRYLSNGVLNEILKDEKNAFLRVKAEERKSPLKRLIQHFESFKDLDPDKVEEGDIFKTTDGSVFKAIGTPDYTVKTVLAKCLQSNNVWHVFGDKLYICIENVTKLPKATPEGFPVGSYVTQIKDGEGGVYRITGELDELGCQTAERIVPRRYKSSNRKHTGAKAAAYLSPEIFRIIEPEEMNEKLIEYMDFISIV